MALAAPILGNSEFVNDIQRTLDGNINSFYLKGDPVKRAPRLGWIDLPSAKDLSLYLPYLLIGDKNHYFEAIRCGIYKAFCLNKKEDDVLVTKIIKDRNLMYQDSLRITGLCLVTENNFLNLWNQISRPKNFEKEPLLYSPSYSQTNFYSNESLGLNRSGYYGAADFNVYM